MNATKSGCEQLLTSWPQDQMMQHVGYMMNLNRELRAEGSLVAAEGLAFPHEAKIVVAGPDGAPVTDGIFPESKEFLMGYWIVEVASAEEAYKIAARASMAPPPPTVQGRIPIEVRQIMAGPPVEG